MMMKHISTIFTIALAASALLLSSCAKELGGSADGTDRTPLSFSAGTSELVKAKAAAVTSVTEFYTMGYDGSTQWFPTSGGPQLVQIPGGETFDDYKWFDGKCYTFYGYANMPELTSVAEASITEDGVTLTYTAVPATASEQKDILLGLYSGDGDGTGTAAMTFYHPLSQVVFTVGDIEAISKISSISIKGVYGAGTTTLNTSTTITDGIAQFGWTDRSGSTTVSQTVTGYLPEEDAQIGEPFMLIPQTITSPANLKIQMTATTTAGEDQTITAELTGITLEAGKKTVFAVSYSAQHGLKFTATVTGWEATGEQELELEKACQIIYTTSSSWPISVHGDSPFKDKDGNTLTYIDDYDYDAKRGVITINGELYEVSDDAFKFEAGDWDDPLSIEFPEGLVKLGRRIFYQSSGLVSVKFPASTIDILPEESFYFGYPLMSINVTVGDTEFKIGNGGSYTSVNWPGLGPVNICTCCFAKGTLITLADGSRKPVEELTYEDRLKVWNFDEGTDDSAKILWITKSGLKAPYFFRCTLSDGTVLDLIGEEDEGTHRLFNKTAGKFEYPDQMAPGSEIYTEHGLVTVVSFERVDEEVEFYNLITDKQINCYANEVLTSCRYNNIYPIDDDMKFVKDCRTIRPYREFRKAGISREWYDGLRLGEQAFEMEDMVKYIDRLEKNQAPKPETDQPGFFARIWNWIKGIFAK